MCDTFIALQNVTSDGSIIFGKNSDREPNEAQILEFHPPKEHPGIGKIRCTYLEIPQVKKTYAVLLSRPFWMWGAEMGANEKGVVIGNEAVWTRMPLIRNGRLTGMDILRLALERSSTAASALETIFQLLADHRQGGVCGYEDKGMVYHNSFIVADPKEAWVLETAGPLWAALKVKDMYSISNGLTIGEEFDGCHPDLIPFARKKGWIKKGETFHFARSYSDWLYTTFSACRVRQNCSNSQINNNKGKMNVSSAIEILRDHREKDYHPGSHLLGNRLCAHAANKLFRNASQTVGSFIAHLKPDIQTYWVTGTSAPCTGIFKPVWFEGDVVPDIGPKPDGIFNPKTLWWHHERLHRNVLLDYPKRMAAFKKERDDLEQLYINQSLNPEHGSRFDLSETIFEQARKKTRKWITLVEDLPVQSKSRVFYKRYWNKQNKKARLFDKSFD
jgi:dipeptidase